MKFAQRLGIVMSNKTKVLMILDDLTILIDKEVRMASVIKDLLVII